MVSNEAGNEMEWSDVQAANADWPMLFTACGMRSEESPEQALKARSPMASTAYILPLALTESGMLTKPL